MRVELSHLVGRPLAEIRRFYVSIPAYETELELSGEFDGEVALRKPLTDAALALSYLPKHITSVKFSGSYIVSDNVVSEAIEYDADLDYPNHTLYIGLNLPSYTSCLPSSVTSISFAFLSAHISGDYGYSNIALIKAISLLGPHISHVDLSSMEFRGSYVDVQKLCNVIPASVNSCKITSTSWNLPVYVAWVPRTVIHLDLSGSQLLPAEEDESFLRLFATRRQQIASLSLEKTKLGQRAPTELGVLISGLPISLVSLKLNGNNLARLASKELADVLSGLPEGLEEIDLSDNGLLLLAIENLAEALAGLPLHVTRLKLFERNVTTLSLEHLIQRFQVLPAHIDTLDFSDCELFGLSVDDFCGLLQAIPLTVKTLNFSNNFSNVRCFQECAQILANVPTHITTVLLEKNNFGCLDAAGLTEIFKSCPAHIKRFGLSHNGFNTLMISQLQQRLSALPDVILDFSKDNPLQASSRRPTNSLTIGHGLFKTHFVTKKQHQFAALLPVVQQLIQTQQGVNLDIIQHILSFVLGDLSRAMVQRLDTRIIAQTRPEVVTTEVLDLTIRTVNKRLEIAELTQAIVMDFSRCGLNRIENAGLFQQLFGIIPEGTRELNLVGNGFCQTKETLFIFTKALHNIPVDITHLDLSHNGFELFNGEQLQALFVHLPPTVLTVTIAEGKPLRPTIHIAVRYWPHAYETFLTPTLNLLQQARALLDDYTKGDSKFWRFLFLHWARHHIEDIVRLVMRIDNGLITDAQDLLGELALIEPVNKVGSLSRRISFLNSKLLQATAVEQTRLWDNNARLTLNSADEVEMTTLSYY